MNEQEWKPAVGETVRYIRHLPPKPNVQRFYSDRDIGRAGVIGEEIDPGVYGHVAYLVIWDEPEKPYGEIGLCCAAEQLAPIPAQDDAARTLTIIVPGQVPHRLSPNRGHGRANPRYTTKLKGDMRTTWSNAIRGAWMPGTPPFDGPVRCQITYYRAKGEKVWDGDNLLSTCKVGLDQLQAREVVANDSQIQYAPVKQERDPDGWGFVEITLEAS